MKYGIQVWADWGGETSFLWLSEGSIHDEYLVKAFDTVEEAEQAASQWGDSYVVAPLPDALGGRTEDARHTL